MSTQPEQKPTEEVEAASEAKPAKASKKKKSAAPAVEIDTHYGAVLYTDGGTYQHIGKSGYGVHGYLYADVLNPKGLGHGRLETSDRGYYLKKESDGVNRVNPTQYIDGWGSVMGETTNNAAEIIAATEGLKHLSMLEKMPKKVTIRTDSEYVIKQHTLIPLWQQNGWKKRDGTDVKNVPYWSGLDEQLKKFQEAGSTIAFEWVKGHSGDMGNTFADHVAGIGRDYSAMGVARRVFVDSMVPGAYWKKWESHPFIHHRTCYFVTDPALHNKGEYYVGDHGKDDDDAGTRQADGAFAYYLLNEPDPIIETAMEVCFANIRQQDAVMLAKLDVLHKRENASRVTLFDRDAFQVKVTNSVPKMTVLKIHEEAAVVQQNPPINVMAALSKLNALKVLLGEFLSLTNDDLQIFDITSDFYESDEAGKLSVNKVIVPGYTEHRVKITLQDQQEEISVPMTLGLDLPSLNALRKLTDKTPSLSLVVRKVGERSYRYATVVKVDDAVGIWECSFSNLKVLKKKPASE